MNPDIRISIHRRYIVPGGRGAVRGDCHAGMTIRGSRIRDPASGLPRTRNTKRAARSSGRPATSSMCIRACIKTQMRRSQISATSTSSSSPSAAEKKRTFGVLSVRTVSKDARCLRPNRDRAVYAASPHCVIGSVGAWSPSGLKGSYAPIVCTSILRSTVWTHGTSLT